MVFRFNFCIVLLFFINSFNLFSWPRNRRMSLERLEKNPSLVLQKKSYPSWCSRNKVAFLFNHCKRTSRTFLLPREQNFQNRLAQRLQKLTSCDKHTKFAAFTFTVRVLLGQDEVCTHQQDHWEIKSAKGFLIQPYGIQGKKIFLPGTVLHIKGFTGRIYLDNRRYPYEKILISPAEGYLNYNSNHYEGAFLLAVEDNNVLLINQLDIEDYIFSVLRWESWPGWPTEVNKAFAIACRSYLIAKVLGATKQNKLFHIKSTNIHQTYNGLHGFYNLKEAIDETRGLILAHNKKPIDAMFDCCCGGVIPAKLSGVNFKKAPYLARSYPCNFCKPCKIYSWKLEYSVDDFITLLHNAGHKLHDIEDIKICKKDAAGAVEKVMIKDKYTTLYLAGRELYSLLTKIKSFCYSIEKKGTKLLFEGRGYGHHLGICQWGARRMIDAGFNYSSILQFYYPGTTLMELKNTV